MRRILIPLALLLVLGLGVQADAASALSLLEPYAVNWLEDDDYESGILANNGTTLDEGDFLYGMVVVNPFVETVATGDQRQVSTNGATFTGVFMLKVASKTAIGGGMYDYTFGQATAAEWLAATGYTLQHADTKAVFFSDDDAPTYITPGTGTTLGSLATAMDGTYLWEFGFNDARPGHGFWAARADTDVVAVIGGTASALRFNAAMDVTDQGAGPDLLQFSLWDELKAIAFQGIYTDLQLEGRNILSGVNNDFDVVTDSEIYIKPTPEPASLALLGLGLLGLGGVVYRRRRS